MYPSGMGFKKKCAGKDHDDDCRKMLEAEGYERFWKCSGVSSDRMLRL